MQTIVLATDFSDAANNATDYAVELAKYFSAKLILVNAFTPHIGHNELTSVEHFALVEKNNTERLIPLQKQIMQAGNNGMKFDCFSDVGAPVDVIQKAVEKFKAGMVVIGITGHPNLVKEHWIGSTAIKVAKQLKVNTFIIREGVKFQKIRKISFACDFEKTEKSTLLYIAKYFTTVFEASLKVVNVTGEWVQVDKLKTLQFVEDNLRTVDHDITFVKDTDPGHSLENYINSRNTDALIVSPKEHNFFHSLFNRSVTNRLIFHADLPIIVIH
ncbi:MAG: universal stress protein [Bacteroidia bacterium]